MINYGKQSIDRKDISEVLKVLKSDWLTQGPQIKKIELAIKKHFQVRILDKADLWEKKSPRNSPK